MEFQIGDIIKVQGMASQDVHSLLFVDPHKTTVSSLRGDGCLGFLYEGVETFIHPSQCELIFRLGEESEEQDLYIPISSKGYAGPVYTKSELNCMKAVSDVSYLIRVRGTIEPVDL